MPNITLFGDTCVGNIQSGTVMGQDPKVTAPVGIASQNDDVLVSGLTSIPPNGVREVVSFPTKFTPNGTPIEWFITEYGTIMQGSATVLSSKSMPVAYQGCSWTSAHFQGTILGTSMHQVPG